MTDYEAVILDVDGTLVRGADLIPGVAETLETLEQHGLSRLLFSNNPTRGAAYYRDKLATHGLEVDPETVLTSATVTAEYLATTHPNDRVYLIGEDRLRMILEDRDLRVVDEPTDADLVVGSIDRALTYDTLQNALDALERDVPFYGTDPDVTIPVDGGSIPGSGAILAALEAIASRKPDAILGKPSEVAATAAMDRLETSPERTLVVGDRLDTDIELGRRAGMDTAVVGTGVTDTTALDPSNSRPTYVLDSLAALAAVLDLEDD